MGLEERTERVYVTTRAFLEAAVLLAAELTTVVERASGLRDSSLSVAARYTPTSSESKLPWVRLNDRGLRVRTTLSPWLPAVKIDAALSVPAGWMIEDRGGELIGALEAHGFNVDRLDAPTARLVQAYPACPEVAADSSIEPPETRRFPADSWWVSADQPGARLLFTIVEPWSQDSWLAAVAEIDCTVDTYPVFRVPA
jgi:hypothetical protein